MMVNAQKTKKISVIGLGKMGWKIAELLIRDKREVTVWNRTLSKAGELSGATIANDPAAAVEASSVIIICVFDNNAVQEILESIAEKSAFKDKIIINLTTGSPAEAARLETWISAADGRYLNGAIQVAPDQMGLPDTTILLSGDNDGYTSSKEILSLLGGNVKYLDSKAAASAAMDLATLSWLYGSYIGMLYGVALCQDAGLKLDTYSNLLTQIMPGFNDFFKHEINVIEQNDYQITQSPLSISVSATERIVNAIQAIHGATEFPDAIAQLLKKAEGSGYGEQELAAVIKVIQRTNQ